VPLTIYRRHGKKCAYYGKSRNARNARSCQSHCSIWVEGCLAGQYVRKSLDVTYWEAALTLVRSWELAGRIGPILPPDQVLGPALPPGGGVPARPERGSDGSANVASRQAKASRESKEGVPLIPEAVDRFMASLAQQHLSWETIRKYRTLLKGRLLRWCEREELVVVRDLSVTRMDDFRGTWTDGAIYATKNLERLRAFFQYCVDRDWIEKNSAKAIKVKYLLKNEPRSGCRNKGALHGRGDGRDTRDSDAIPAAGEAAPGGRGVRQGIRHQAGESAIWVNESDRPAVVA
jgi:hypothetical protein